MFPWLVVSLVIGGAFLAPRVVGAQDPIPRALHQPTRLTAGSSNQWMGTLSPDGKALYFVSDRNATREIFVQAPVDSAAPTPRNSPVPW